MNTQFRIGDGGGDGEYGKIYTYIHRKHKLRQLCVWNWGA